MTQKFFAAALLAVTLAGPVSAQEAAVSHFKPYGFIRNYAVMDTRESVYGTEDFFYYVPKDTKVVGGDDLNQQLTFSFAAITSRLGLDVTGYEYEGWKFGAKFDQHPEAIAQHADGRTGTALFRLRQAYLTASKGGFSLKAGQAWHPMAADMPHVFSLNTGAPFGPFCRTPEVVVDGKTSQFLSALLMVAPLLDEPTTIHVSKLNEKPYVLITLDWLKRQDIKVKYDDAMTCFEVPGGHKYKPFSTLIPVDFSTAAFPLLAAAVTGGEVKIPNLDFDDLQGDKAVFDYFAKMGVKITQGQHSTAIKGPRKLKAFDLDLNATPDALPVMAVAAACADGVSYLRNVPQARIKETDRIACMTAELRKMGVSVEELEDGMVITGGKLKGCADLQSYKDHRIAMALAVAGLAASGETVVRNAECAAVTYPAFFDAFKALGADFTLE